MLLTDDGVFIKKLLSPSFGHPRTYYAQVDGDITSQALSKLEKGVVIGGYKTKPCRAEKIEEPPFWERTPPIRYRKDIPTSWISLTLTEGKLFTFLDSLPRPSPFVTAQNQRFRRARCLHDGINDTASRLSGIFGADDVQSVRKFKQCFCRIHFTPFSLYFIRYFSG